MAPRQLLPLDRHAQPIDQRCTAPLVFAEAAGRVEQLHGDPCTRPSLGRGTVESTGGEHMRRNGFNEPICTTADEVYTALDVKDLGPSEVYAHEVGKAANDSPNMMLEVLDNIDGETVCWIEARKITGCHAIANDVGIEIQD